MNWKDPLKNIRQRLNSYITNKGIKSLVIGISGGVDSALIVAIARPVCDELKIRLIGRSLPHASNKSEELARAEKVGKAFCNLFDTHSITQTVSQMAQICNANCSQDEDDKLNKIALGNIKARVRMIVLYNLAYRTRGMVMCTDNFTEFSLGFWTLHGDVGDYGMIQNLWKTEVYDLSRWICENELDRFSSETLMSCIHAVPTDGFGITNSDLDQIGAPTYLEVDNILKTWFTENLDSFYDENYLNYDGRLGNPEEFFKYRDSLRIHPVVQRHIKSGFKRKNPLNLNRNQIFK